MANVERLCPLLERGKPLEDISRTLALDECNFKGAALVLRVRTMILVLPAGSTVQKKEEDVKKGGW